MNFTGLYLKTVFADNMSFLTRRVTNTHGQTYIISESKAYAISEIIILSLTCVAWQAERGI